MIITKIIGGFGNQLFQFAAGRCLAYLNQTELKLDVSGFDEYKVRNFDLMNMNVNTVFAGREEISKFIPHGLRQKGWQRLLPVRKRYYYREPYFHFDKRFHTAGSNIYIKGHWQSEKYFLPIKDIIRSEFILKYDVISNVNEFGLNLQNENSVGVHIRRGDYTNPAVTIMHGILTQDYYKKSMEYIKKKSPSAKFYFFSDDIKWAKENLNTNNAEFVSGFISKNHFEDFYLMSQCQHNIIANSSFSWWPAWLNKNPDKIIIAPKNWFNKGPQDIQDLLPEAWIKL